MSIKVITEPKVYLLGRQRVDFSGLADFLADENCSGWETDAPAPGETLIEVAGRLCYMSFKKPRPGGNKAYIGHILEVGHGSVLEHEVFGMVFTGVSRSLTHELVRHRAGFGYSQLSQRYVDESDVAFVVPPAFAEGVRYYPDASRVFYGGDRQLTDADEAGRRELVRLAYRNWYDAAEWSLKEYRKLVGSLEDIFRRVDDRTARRKAAREAARSVLPNCTETKLFITGNARAWRTMLEMRGSLAADAEIRRLSVVVLGVLKRESPNVFADFEVKMDPDHGEYLECKHHKV